MTRYRSAEEDSDRWTGFAFRDGDVVISTRSKSGTTWMQMICATLVLGSPRLPQPLGELSPWLDHLVEPREVVWARLAAQLHRRVIKTHTPLDGIPLDPRVTYIVVARNPLDMAVSLYHQGDNIDRARMRELIGGREPAEPPAPRPSLHDWLVRWISAQDDPREVMDSLPGVMSHLSDAWARRNEQNVLLVHYDDLQADLDGQMRRIADQLGVTPDEQVWPDLVQAATFEQMRACAGQLAPGGGGVLKDVSAFFRRGRSGGGAEVLAAAERDAYETRATALAPADLLAWLHRRS